jgi:hypothetical protein
VKAYPFRTKLMNGPKGIGVGGLKVSAIAHHISLLSTGRIASLSFVRCPRHFMRIHHITTIGFIALLAVLAVGCSSMTADEEHDVRLSFGLPADVPMKDLGVVELRPGIPERARVGWRKDCTITATVLTNGSVQLNLLYESKGEVIDGVKTRSHSERSQFIIPRKLVPRPGGPDRGWFCFPPLGRRLVVVIKPIIMEES